MTTRRALRMREVALDVGVSTSTVQRWVDSGDLTHIRPSKGVVLIAPDDLDRFLEQHREGNTLTTRRRR